MRAAKIIESEINLGAVDVNVCIVSEGEANAVVDGEDEFTAGDVILQTLGGGLGAGKFLAAGETQRCLKRRRGLRARRAGANKKKRH